MIMRPRSLKPEPGKATLEQIGALLLMDRGMDTLFVSVTRPLLLSGIQFEISIQNH